MKVHLNEGNDIEDASHMVNAMQSSGGVPGKFDGISAVSNVKYGEGSLTMWKAYGIGPGKTVKLSQFTGEDNNAPLPRLSSTVTEELSDKFTSSKSRSTKPETKSSSDESSGPPATSQLFFCPEEGCIKSYRRFSALQLHLDCGKHERTLERETLLDKAVRGYAVRLEEQFESVPQLQQSTGNLTTANQPSIPMGWALKASQALRAQFNEKQKDYLLNKFLIGMQTGQKINAASVARSMISARDTSGNRMFTRSEFLTAQQIMSYFSRLAAKHKIQGDHTVQTESDSDDESAEDEMDFSDLRGEILENIQPIHPICFDNYNLCEMGQAKLSKFAVAMLNRICVNFEIPVDDIKVHKKAPYISRIEEFLKKCSCHQ